MSDRLREGVDFWPGRADGAAQAGGRRRPVVLYNTAAIAPCTNPGRTEHRTGARQDIVRRRQISRHTWPSARLVNCEPDGLRCTQS